MISFRYLLPINLPFFLSICGAFIYLCSRHKTAKYFCIFLIWAFSANLYETKHDGGSASIPGNGTEAYKEARAYIAADTAAHPDIKSAMSDNAPEIAAYYGYENLPAYTPDGEFAVVYFLGDIFYIHESDMYNKLHEYGLNDNNLLKIHVNDTELVFKKIMTSNTEKAKK
jgi:hypothetical protein